jgi:phenazine biosynthesis protein phzE
MSRKAITFPEIRQLAAGEPAAGFALLQLRKSDKLVFLQGPVRPAELLRDIPRFPGRKDSVDTLSILPFSQAAERGYKVRRGDETIRSLVVAICREIPVADFVRDCPKAELGLERPLEFSPDEAGYVEAVRAITEDEIGNGEGANFLISRRGRSAIRGFDLDKALAVFANILRSDYGSYWKFIFFDGRRYFIGSTPERHVTVNQGKVTMNPISGTFRKATGGLAADAAYQELAEFLRDPKEVNELFMVLDEELKMMARICAQGGEVRGPFLKEMSQLIHTEYKLEGKSEMDVFDIVRESMFAATMTGSPLENAFNIIHKYEAEPRRYYSSALILAGHDAEGREWVDSPILIRTLDIAPDGGFTAQVGASLVRDSVGASEFQETESKIRAVVRSLATEVPPAAPALLPAFSQVQKLNLQALLRSRNVNLSHFWMDPQLGAGENLLAGAKIRIIDNEDDFTWMIRHVLTRLGASVDITRHDAFDPGVHGAGLYVVGPGPGNPNDADSPKMARNISWVKRFLETGVPFMGVCLGHQLISRAIGLKVVRKDVPSQGVQKRINLFGETEYVGFYNTFVPVLGTPAAVPVETALDDNGRDIIALRGPRFASFQFHPESILTQRSTAILGGTAAKLLRQG